MYHFLCVFFFSLSTSTLLLSLSATETFFFHAFPFTLNRDSSVPKSRLFFSLSITHTHTHQFTNGTGRSITSNPYRSSIHQAPPPASPPRLLSLYPPNLSISILSFSPSRVFSPLALCKKHTTIQKQQNEILPNLHPHIHIRAHNKRTMHIHTLTRFPHSNKNTTSNLYTQGATIHYIKQQQQ